MEYKHKQLEQELSGLSKAFSDLGARLSEAAREVTASGVLPSEKLQEQISASRASFESARTAVHGHAAAMLVSPLPKPGDLASIAAIGSLLKAAAAAEENKFSIEAEREQALKSLARALTLAHRDVTEFKPLQECHAKLAELRNAIYNVPWPHRHPDSESLATSRHPSNALLNFVENLEAIEDEKWMALEATITGAYGKPLFVAASRGKLELRGETKSEGKVETKPAEPVKPAAPAPAPAPQAKAPVAAPPEPPKPAAAAERPVEKPAPVEKAPEKPAVAPAAVAAPPSAPVAAQPTPSTKKIVVTPAVPQAAPAVPAAATAVVEKKEVAQEKTPDKPAVAPPATLTAAPEQAPKVPPTPVVNPEKKEAVEKPQPVLSPSSAPAAGVPAVATPPVVLALPPVVPASAPAAAPSPVMRTATVVTPPVAPSPVAGPAALPRVAPPAPVAAAAAPTPAAPPVPAAPPAEASVFTPPASTAPVGTTINSLSALASATEPAIEKKPAAPVPVEAADNHRREPRLATPALQAVSKSEAPETNGAVAGEEHKAADGDGQRPQRWGFWRGNR